MPKSVKTVVVGEAKKYSLVELKNLDESKKSQHKTKKKKNEEEEIVPSKNINQIVSKTILEKWAVLDKEDLFFEDEEIKKIMKDLNKSKLQIKQHINNKKRLLFKNHPQMKEKTFVHPFVSPQNLLKKHLVPMRL